MKPLRVILVNLGRRSRTFQLTTPPLGILYLAAYLRTRFDLQIRIIDQKIDNCSAREIAARVIEYEPDIVGLSVMTTTAYQLGEITRYIRRGIPRALILLGGPHIFAFQELSLRNNSADAAVSGEGELSLAAVIQARLSGEDLAGIAGLIRRTADGAVVTNPGRMPPIEDLDSLPLPAYDLIDLSSYWKLQSIAPLPRRRYISLLSSRGCPYRCMWCHSIFGKRFRPHSPERIVEELSYFTQTYGLKDVEFIDDIFNLDPDRVTRLADEVNRRRLPLALELANGVRADILTDETVEALASLNLYWCSMSLETASSRLQEFTGKRLNIPKFLAGVEMVARKSIFTNGFAMFGFPTETSEEMQLTLETMVSSTLHTASFFTVLPFPNTRLYEVAREYCPERLERLNYDDVNFSSVRINLSAVPDAELFGFQRRANRVFFTRPRRIFRILRDYPGLYRLPAYLPIFLDRLTKGW